MQKFFKWIAAFLILPGIVLVLASCGGDDDPPAKPKVSVTVDSNTAHEGSLIGVQFSLDKALSQNATIEYEFSGSANDDVSVFSDTPGTIVIPAGEVSIVETLAIVADGVDEANETLTITITSVGGSAADIGSGSVSISIPEINNGLKVELTWNYSDPGDVDMDLFAWFEVEENSFNVVGLSINESTDEPEAVVIPDAAPDGIYGFSYNYYSGSADPLDFTVNIIPISNGIEGTPIPIDVQYTDANVNPWDTSGNQVEIVQLASKTGSDWDFTDIVVPDVGSKFLTKKITFQKRSKN